MSAKQSLPPHLAEQLLIWLGAPDFIIGDFAEEFEQVVENGRIQANIWYWQHLFLSTPALCQRRWQTAMKTLTKRDKQFFVLGVFLLIPALLIGVTGVLHSVFSISAPMNNMFDYLRSTPLLAWIIHPGVILGGLGVAFILNALSVFHISVQNQTDRFVGSVAIRKGHWLQMIVLGTAVLFLLIIFVYLIAENL